MMSVSSLFLLSRPGMAWLTSLACFPPSYSTRSTLTFSRASARVLMLPNVCCFFCKKLLGRRDVRVVKDAVADRVRREDGVRRANRVSERVSSTILVLPF